ncbi:MAG: FAD-dependent oxidoreductase [Armatimonadota bacterium]
MIAQSRLPLPLWLLIYFAATEIMLPGTQAQVAGVLTGDVTPAYRCDVCVLGGGPSGTAAAIAAARNGTRTLLIEQLGYLGGTATAAGVNVFMTYQHSGGILREVLQRLDAIGGRRGSCFDIAKYEVVLDEMVQEAGVKVLFYTRGVAALTAPGRPWRGQPRNTISRLLIHNKSGLQLVQAKVFIDCTGDGDLASWAGAPFEVGRPEDGLTQPMTMVFRMGGCTFKGGSISQYPGLEDYWASYAFNPNPGEITLNMTRIHNRSGLSGEGMTQATMEGRREVLKAVELLTKNVPGFENAYLLDLPEQIGVRETRRILGATVLTGEQCVKGMERGDAIARCQYPIDIHNPTGTGATWFKLQKPYDIPYRSLIPRGVDNLLVAGRPISADHVAHSSLRIQPTCYALGQAAGTAAALCVRRSVGPWELAPYLRDLQALLIRQGADLGPTAARRLGLEDEWERWQLRYQRTAGSVPVDGFSDIPKGDPAYDAAMGLARLGVFHGYGDGVFGARDTATVAMALVVFERALETGELGDRTPRPSSLPDRLTGSWWSGPLAVLVTRGVVLPEELEALEPNAPATADLLRVWALRAFPSLTAEDLKVLEAVANPSAVTRAELARLVWQAVRDLAD